MRKGKREDEERHARTYLRCRASGPTWIFPRPHLPEHALVASCGLFHRSLDMSMPTHSLAPRPETTAPTLQSLQLSCTRCYLYNR